MPRAHPMRSATTVAGIVGQSFSSARIRSSKASTADVCRGRRYEGGSPDLTATRTVLRATPTRFAIVLMPKPSAKCSLRISAQSSTVSTSPLPERPAWSTQARPEITVRYGFRSRGVKIQPALGGQFCTGADSHQYPNSGPIKGSSTKDWVATDLASG